MQALDKRLVGHALRIAQLRRHRKNVEELHRKLTILADVKQTQQNLQVRNRERLTSRRGERGRNGRSKVERGGGRDCVESLEGQGSESIGVADS